MKKHFKSILALTMVATMAFTGSAFAGTNNAAGSSGQSGFDFEIETEYDRTETTVYTIDLTNTLNEEKILYVAKVQGTKTWEDNDNAAGKRPESVTIHLYADNEDTGKEFTISEATDWKYEFSDLKLKDEDGHTISYSIKEDVPEGYSVSYKRKLSVHSEVN